MSNENKGLSENQKPTIPKPSLPQSDEKSRRDAKKEQQQFEKEQSEHERDQITRKVLAWCMWGFIAAVFVLMIGSVLTLGWHSLSSKNLHWLDYEQIQVLKNFVLSGAVVGFGTTYLRRYIDGR